MPSSSAASPPSFHLSPLEPKSSARFTVALSRASYDFDLSRYIHLLHTAAEVRNAAGNVHVSWTFPWKHGYRKAFPGSVRAGAGAGEKEGESEREMERDGKRKRERERGAEKEGEKERGRSEGRKKKNTWNARTPSRGMGEEGQFCPSVSLLPGVTSLDSVLSQDSKLSPKPVRGCFQGSRTGPTGHTISRERRPVTQRPAPRPKWPPPTNPAPKATGPPRLPRLAP